MVKADTTRPKLRRAKVVMLGSPNVGKTSMVRRYVESVFSEDYHSTLGMKVDRKLVVLGETTVNLVLWDVHGETEGLDIPDGYLRGAAGALLVFDATRPETIVTTALLGARLLELSPKAKTIFAANKTDREHDWAAIVEKLAEFSSASPIPTSAKTGDGVEELFTGLAKQIIQAPGSAEGTKGPASASSIQLDPGPRDNAARPRLRP